MPAPTCSLNFDFQNGPDSVVLRDALGTAVDALGYGIFAAGEVFAGEGSPAPDPAAGSSLARVFADVDTDDNARGLRGARRSRRPAARPLSPVPGARRRRCCSRSGLAGLALLGRR